MFQRDGVCCSAAGSSGWGHTIHPVVDTVCHHGVRTTADRSPPTSAVGHSACQHCSCLSPGVACGQVDRIISRLRQVCAAEGLSIDRTVRRPAVRCTITQGGGSRSLGAASAGCMSLNWHLERVRLVGAMSLPVLQRCIRFMSCVYPKPSVPALLQALAALVERAQGDVRACLNTLQLLARAGRPVRLADVKAAAAGHKDIAASAFGLWQDLFSDRVDLGWALESSHAFCSASGLMWQDLFSDRVGFKLALRSPHVFCSASRLLWEDLFSERVHFGAPTRPCSAAPPC